MSSGNCAPPERDHLFDLADWLSFGVATAVMQAVYLATLNPDIGLRNDGVSAASAAYGGVAMPAGFPVWTMWTWSWSKIIPWGTLGWRVSFATALAGSLTCGVIALLVSCCGLALPGRARNDSIIRAGAGASAAIVFGLDAAFWPQAVIPDPWTMSNLLLSLVIATLMRWSHAPQSRKPLYCAAWLYGLALTQSQMALTFAPAIPFVLALADLKLGRDMFALGGIFYLLVCDGADPALWNGLRNDRQLPFFHFFGCLALVFAGLGFIKTRRLFTEWRPALACSLAFVAGWAVCLEIVFVGMTNPPVNWGYPRTPAGFFHVITRGQYDKVMMGDLSRFPGQLLSCLRGTADAFGWPGLTATIVPFISWRRWSDSARRWLLTFAVIYLSSTLLTVLVLNPKPDDFFESSFPKMYFTPSHILLAIVLGCALTILGRRIYGVSPVNAPISPLREK